MEVKKSGITKGMSTPPIVSSAPQTPAVQVPGIRDNVRGPTQPIIPVYTPYKQLATTHVGTKAANIQYNKPAGKGCNCGKR